MQTRLAVIVDTFPRWSERFIARELNELLRRGVDVGLFAFKRGALPFGADPEFEALLPRLKILPRPLRAAAGRPGLRRGLPAAAADAVRRELGWAGLLRAARARPLAAALREGGFTHVQAHFANWPSTVGWLAAHEAGLPFSLSVHARDLFVEAQLLREKACDAAAIFACHGRAWEYLRARPGVGAKAVRMYHGLPLAEFPFHAPRAQGAGRGAPRELLAAGRFVAKKGLGDLVAALRCAVLRDQPLRLTLLGEGPARAALRRAIARARLSAQVRLLPPESGPQLRQRLAAADLLVAPSREAGDGDRDGIPNIVLEAFALGVPVVGTAAGSLPEVLSEETGFVAGAGDPESLAQAIRAALDNADAAREKAHAARRLIEARHDLARTIEPLVELLRS